MHLARTEDLVVEQLAHETLVYDLRTDEAHTLDDAAAAIWHSCDGEHTTLEIAMLTGRSEDVVVQTIALLVELGLVDADGQTRRQYLRTGALVGAAAAAAFAIPTIKTVVAPTAAQAATLLQSGATCSTDVQCQSGFCNGNVCT